MASLAKWLSVCLRTKWLQSLIIKTIDDVSQYDLIRQTAGIFVLSLENVCKYTFSMDEDVLPETRLIEKAVTIKRFEYSPLGKELKKQSDITGKQNQGLSRDYEFEKKEGHEAINKEK